MVCGGWTFCLIPLFPVQAIFFVGTSYTIFLVEGRYLQLRCGLSPFLEMSDQEFLSSQLRHPRSASKPFLPSTHPVHTYTSLTKPQRPTNRAVCNPLYVSETSTQTCVCFHLFYLVTIRYHSPRQKSSSPKVCPAAGGQI